MSQQSVDFEIDIDTTNVKEFGGESFAPEVPPGEYVLDLVEIEQKTSKAQNSMLVVTFEVAEGEFAGKKLTGWYTLTDKAMGRIKKLQIACGARLDKIRTSELRGARIIATVIHEEGKPMPKPDGTMYPPSIFAKVQSERPLEDVQAQPEPVAPPPVARGGKGAPVRRA
jgi:hypothetical protein